VKNFAFAKIFSEFRAMLFRVSCFLCVVVAVLFCFDRPAVGIEQVPEVSVIVPVYNVAPYLARALDSAIGQTFTDIEIICVDDGSTDGSLDILEEYARRDSRIVVLKNGTNRGSLYARVRGFLAAKGNFIACLDPDDEFISDIIEKAHAAAIKMGADVVHFDSERIYPNGKAYRWLFWQRPIMAILNGKEVPSAFAKRRIGPQIWNKLYARQLILQAAHYLLPFSEENNMIYSEDRLLSAFIFKNAQKYVGLNDIGYRYYRYTGITASKYMDLQTALRLRSNSRDAHLKMVLGMIELGESAYAVQLQDGFQSSLYEYIAALPLKDGIDLLMRYIDGVPLKQQLRIARGMRSASPRWCNDIHRIAKNCH
jgi:glycosyltransferase EpsH